MANAKVARSDANTGLHALMDTMDALESPVQILLMPSASSGRNEAVARDEEPGTLTDISENSIQTTFGASSTMNDDNFDDEIPTSKNCTTFTCFPKFPIELRLKVWKDACFIPRNVNVFYVSSLHQHESFEEELLYKLVGIEYKVFKSSNPVPPILHTSRESRNVGLQHYTLEFEKDFLKQFSGLGMALKSPPSIYVNWNVDMICPSASPEEFDEEIGDTIDEVMVALTRSKMARRVAVPYEFATWVQSGAALLHLDEIVLYFEEPISSSWYFNCLDDYESVTYPTKKFVDTKSFFKRLENEEEFDDIRDMGLVDFNSMGKAMKEKDELVRKLLKEMDKETKLPGWKPPKVNLMLMDYDHLESATEDAES